MYTQLKSEIKKRGFTIRQAAKMIGIAEKSLRNKINGHTEFTWSETKKLRDVIAPGASLEELFQRDQSAA